MDTLRTYLEVYPIAKYLFLEVGFRLVLPNKTTIRKPDLFVVRNDNPVPLHDTDRTYAGISDLCVESLSDSTQEEIERDTITKKHEYAQVGVKEYYILDAGDEMNFYRLNARVRCIMKQVHTACPIFMLNMVGIRRDVRSIHLPCLLDRCPDASTIWFWHGQNYALRN